MKAIRQLFILLLIIGVGYIVIHYLYQQFSLKAIVERLSADSRAAEVLVTGINFDEATQRNYTTIKFLEYDAKGQALKPKYFTFPGRLLQFQSLVVRFDDKYVKMGDSLRGKSVYLFLKAFALDGPNTREFDITPIKSVPEGYQVSRVASKFEEQFWNNFWKLAYDETYATHMGVKNVQIEAPGTMFVPGYLYTITIEHDGGLRIDTKILPPILRGETIQ